MVTSRTMPASLARATTESSSPAKSGKSRWQWLSTNANPGGKGPLAAVLEDISWIDRLAGAQEVLKGLGSKLAARATLPHRTALVQHECRQERPSSEAQIRDRS